MNSPIKMIPSGRGFAVEQIEIITRDIFENTNTAAHELTFPTLTKITAVLNAVAGAFFCTSAGITLNLARVTKLTGSISYQEVLVGVGAACALINAVTAMRTAFCNFCTKSPNASELLENQLDKTAVASVIGLLCALTGAMLLSGPMLTKIDASVLIDKLPVFPDGLLHPQSVPGMTASSVPVTSMFLMDTALAVMMVHIYSLVSAAWMLYA